MLRDTNKFSVSDKLNFNSKYITNNANVNANGQIIVEECHNKHECLICPRNLCKSKALRDYLNKNDKYQRIWYIGDGRNDYCPVQSVLTENDVVFAR